MSVTCNSSFRLLVISVNNFATIALIVINCYCLFGLASGPLESTSTTSCGRVPIYEKTLGRNINRTEVKWEHKVDPEDSGGSRILFGLDAIK